MSEFRITCTRRQGARDTHVGLTHLGGDDWTWSRDEVVRAIDAGEHAFYLLVGGRRVHVGVVAGAIGRYLRGRAGGLWTDDLLALPQCPDS